MATTPYRGLPPLGGLCSMEDAMREGVSVEECVRRLKRFHYAFKRLQGDLHQPDYFRADL